MPRPEEHLSPDRPLADGEAERIAERMAAFATASRLKLLYALVGRELGVDELAQEAGLGANAVSQQLRVLRHLRMVTVQPRRAADALRSSTTTISSTCWARSGTSSSTPSTAGSTRRRVSDV